jgi:hypothetical protein
MKGRLVGMRGRLVGVRGRLVGFEFKGNVTPVSNFLDLPL